VQNQSFPVTLTTGGSWALLRKSAVESTTLAQPFCVNQAVGDLLWHFHFMGEYSKIDTVKTMGTPRKINAIWWNIKINLQKLVDIRSYELPINLQSFTQKDLTEVNIFQKVLGGGRTFIETPGMYCTWCWGLTVWYTTCMIRQRTKTSENDKWTLSKTHS